MWALADPGVQILLPRAEIVARCLDKLVLMEFLHREGVPVPRTGPATRGHHGMSFPVIVKPQWVTRSAVTEVCVETVNVLGADGPSTFRYGWTPRVHPACSRSIRASPEVPLSPRRREWTRSAVC